MNKKYLIVLIFIMLCSCSSSQVIKEAGSEFNKAYLKNTVGNFRPFFCVMDEKIFNAWVKKWKERISISDSMTVDKQNMIDKIDSLKFSEKQYFYFSITFSKLYMRSKDDEVLTFVDSKGNNLLESIISNDSSIITSSYTQKNYVISWSFKSTKPIEKEYFTENEIPLTFSIVFMKDQKLWYTITPK
ncbi:hypothetical protein ACFL4G_00490 [Thermodesulfobacteriota bacterium]